MGFGAFLTGIVGPVVTVITNCSSAIGTALTNLARTIVVNGPKIEMILRVISAAVETLSQIFGLINKDETAEDLGAKAAESDKSAEEFQSTEDYIQYLREEVQLDAEKMKNLKPEERMAYTAIGTAILAKGIEEKAEISIPADFWVEVGKQNMKAEEVKAYIEQFKVNGFEELKLSDYLKGNLSISENKQIASIMESTLKELNSELSAEEIQEKMMEMKQISNETEGR
ncbi:hypothetical protein [Evansella tamaricis]|uniref:Uncharacterized protein n=1 Tax=Evansella tamaricis TaxID=2069301 RepID=A0ABS6JGB7_9BACI|nr:hypothetical protein [Evansella tamaricis]MBU9712742.1 hypothetical protein [Evansella tamaricis]